MIQSPDKKIRLPDGDTWEKWHGDWELEEYNEVMQHISEKGVAIDIGAHVGLWSKRFQPCLLFRTSRETYRMLA